MPANMMGCFIMGFMISGDEFLGIPVDLPIAFLNRKSPLQNWTTLHLGIRTGLCGALTTFASWNTQMVVMICAGNGTALSSQWISALFGYMVGLGMALASFEMGRHVALLVHRFNNIDLSQEADELQERSGSHGEFANLRIHRELPDFERRFLHDLLQESIVKESRFIDETGIDDDDDDDDDNPVKRASSHKSIDTEDGLKTESLDHFSHLQKWKDTTSNHRNGRIPFGGQFQSELHAIEYAIIVKDEDPREDLLDMARDAGWDVDALKSWKRSGMKCDDKLPKVDAMSDVDLMYFTLPLLLLSVALLIWGTISLSGLDAESQTYRVSMLSCLLAPSGTLLRYYLSNFNGKITSKRLQWLPLGTLSANLLGSCISAIMVALKVSRDRSPVGNLWLNAMKGGFAGCLSTVSTFITETVGLMRALPRHFWGYYYCLGSLSTACIIGVVSYVWAIR
jgi:fluoride ion exporter CrcB/FEX